MKMKETPASLLIIALEIVSLALTNTKVVAQELLAIDFGAAGAETGFVEQSSTNATHATAAGDLTVDPAGVQGIFNFATTGANEMTSIRDSPKGPLKALNFTIQLLIDWHLST
ncbi:MAG: hypothetical protein ABGZ19_02530 [Verrucomicrobiales bacterium]